MSAAECTAKLGCCYAPAPVSRGDAPLRLPDCFKPNGGASTYAAAAGATTATLPAKGQLTSTASAAPTLGPDVSPLDFEVALLAPDVARVSLSAPGRWRLPASVLPGAAGVAAAAKGDGRPPLLDVAVEGSPFGVVVRRANTSSASSSSASSAPPLLDTRPHRLVFKDHYIELTTSLPATSSVYGLGERTASTPTLPLRRDGVPLALWARDSAAADADVNTYASWPAAWVVGEDGGASAIVLLTSNGLDVVLTRDALTFRVTGGVVDLLVLAGPTPADVARQLAAVTGRPTLQPLWAFGLMNSKYGYASAAQTERVLDSYEAAGVPLEAWVSDSQYMKDDAAFTWSDDFDRAAMASFVRRLHASGRRWVPILDPVIRATRGYAPYDDGLAGGVFVTDVRGDPYVGQMWPGATVWPDFLDNAASDAWWGRLIDGLGRAVGGVDGEEGGRERGV